ncbi:MAG: cysteine-rich CWC family protein [Gammaproteobacteria bacterium]|nr:cysteine-rich CWC family protein [Gammaproteobacteria bacterium]MBU2177957.1 cysteine-rich CWC family protein [Gammaproteobacteria bacterium]MBU2223502.1 cysteine-rich CWC family protein [Gammaproteobacteria bacterium]MBU2279203.1 cysteine-rich CWC family protein [Gammaproteobacteria bacterium]MBU2427067.1 cysteine-rich CWC family protein [Gammaproteobacteria bacterium]
MSCPRCGAENQCLVESGQMVTTSNPSQMTGCSKDQNCWCFKVPLTPLQRASLPTSSSCYCAACLDILVKEVNG